MFVVLERVSVPEFVFVKDPLAPEITPLRVILFAEVTLIVLPLPERLMGRVDANVKVPVPSSVPAVPIVTVPLGITVAAATLIVPPVMVVPPLYALVVFCSVKVPVFVLFKMPLPLPIT